MKKILCAVCILSILLIGNMVALADPYGPPATDEPTLVHPPTSTILLYKGK